MGEASGVVMIHFESTQFELHTGKGGQLASEYLSLRPQIIVALISHQINLSVQQMDTITENHHRSKYRAQVIVGVKSQMTHLQHNSFTEGSWDILRARGPGNRLKLSPRDKRESSLLKLDNMGI